MQKSGLKSWQIIYKMSQKKVKTTGFRIRLATWLPSPSGAALNSANHPERVQRVVRRGAVFKTLCKGQSQGQARSPKVIC